MLKSYRADLHVHTVLSPCGDIEMIPPLIVEAALDNKIDLIAITDHNATENAAAVIQAAAGTSLTVLPGMELQTVEEVHALCIFDTVEGANAFQALVTPTMPATKNVPDLFGEQFIVDETGDFISSCTRFLAGSSSMDLATANRLVHELGGLFIPSHVNRNAFGLIQVLGLIPPDLSPDALEVSRHMSASDYAQSFRKPLQFPLIQNGDVHYLSDFAGKTIYNLEAPTIQEIKLALQGSMGRSFSII